MFTLKKSISTILNRALLFFGLGLLLVASLPIATASAAPTTLKDSNDWYYASRFLQNCVAVQKGNQRILKATANDTSKVLAGDGGNRVGIGRYFSADTGWASCSDGTVVQRSLDLLGYSNGVDFLTQQGYKEETDGNGQTYYVNTNPTGDEVLKRAPNQTNAAKYFALRKVLLISCSLTESVPTSTNEYITYSSHEYKDVVATTAGSSSKYEIKTRTVYFNDINNPNPSIDRYDYDTKKTNCANLLGEINPLADAFLKYANENPDENLDPSSASYAPGTADTVGTCAGGGLGWLLCPIMELTEGAIKLLANAIGDFMQFSPLIGSDPGRSIQRVWQQLVGIANLLLVIAFLVVIFSQATSMGLSAYGIKKMLPRIIAAAILINISYYICALAVDISNLIGASTGTLISNATTTLSSSATDLNQKYGFSSQLGASAVTAGILVGAVFAAGGPASAIALILPVILSGVISLFVVFLILALRHIMSILLIIISPLAFAAMILPNTNDMFKKWGKGLITILALYPVIMLLSHGSLLVSKIILLTASEDDGGVSYLLTVSIAFLVMTAWVWALKFIVTWGSGVMGKIAGMVNDPSKGPVDRAKNLSKEYRDRRAKNNQTEALRYDGKGGGNLFNRLNHARMSGRKGVAEFRTGWSAKNAAAGDSMGDARRKYLIDRVGSDKQFLDQLAGPGASDMERAMLAGRYSAEEDKLHAQAVSYKTQEFRRKYSAKDRDSGDDGNGIRGLAVRAKKAIADNDQVALDAISSFMATGGADEYRMYHEIIQKGLSNDAQKKLFSNSMLFTSSTAGGELGPKNPALAAVLQTGNTEINVEDFMRNDLGMRKMYNKVGADKHANYSSDEAKAAAKFISDATLKELVENKGGKYSLSDSARKAYEAEYKLMQDNLREYKNGEGWTTNQDGVDVII